MAPLIHDPAVNDNVGMHACTSAADIFLCRTVPSESRLQQVKVYMLMSRSCRRRCCTRPTGENAQEELVAFLERIYTACVCTQTERVIGWDFSDDHVVC